MQLNSFGKQNCQKCAVLQVTRSIIHSQHFCIFFLDSLGEKKEIMGVNGFVFVVVVVVYWHSFICSFSTPPHIQRDRGWKGFAPFSYCIEQTCPWDSKVKTTSGANQKKRKRKGDPVCSPLVWECKHKENVVPLLSDRLWSQKTSSSHTTGKEGLASQQLILMVPGGYEP